MSKRVYLVDDHAIVRDGLRALLEGAGHQVVGEAAEPTQAMADLLRLQPELLLLDLSLGQRSGFELLEDLHRRQLPCRCIVLMHVRPTTPCGRGHAPRRQRLRAEGRAAR